MTRSRTSLRGSQPNSGSGSEEDESEDAKSPTLDDKTPSGHRTSREDVEGDAEMMDTKS